MGEFQRVQRGDWEAMHAPADTGLLHQVARLCCTEHSVAALPLSGTSILLHFEELQL